jgi:hypothetical protein
MPGLRRMSEFLPNACTHIPASPSVPNATALTCAAGIHGGLSLLVLYPRGLTWYNSLTKNPNAWSLNEKNDRRGDPPDLH